MSGFSFGNNTILSCFGKRLLKANDILISGFEVRRVIEAEPENDYVIALLQSDINGPIDQDEDNIGDFILKNDIYEE